jgi:hypothetical protein
MLTALKTEKKYKWGKNFPITNVQTQNLLKLKRRNAGTDPTTLEFTTTTPALK